MPGRATFRCTTPLKERKCGDIRKCTHTRIHLIMLLLQIASRTRGRQQSEQKRGFGSENLPLGPNCRFPRSWRLSCPAAVIISPLPSSSSLASLVAFRASSVNICKSGDAGKIYSLLAALASCRTSGTCKWIKGFSLSLSLSGIGAREGQAVEASLSLAGDEGIRGGNDRRQARASQHPVALLVKFGKCNSADRTRMTRQRMLPSLPSPCLFP